jgi:DNA repair protein RadA/Sms
MKSKTIYTCSECGHRQAKWSGKCPTCGSWSSFTEEVIEQKKGSIKLTKKSGAEMVKLSDVSAEAEYRMKTGIGELDRVLGGGIIPGSLILVGGDPGIGKSTLMLQMCRKLMAYDPIYCTGEESLQQIKYRSLRLGEIPDDLLVIAETNIEKIIESIRQSDSRIAIIDSIQSVYSEVVESTPGSVSQVRECASMLMTTAKKYNKAIFVIGHVTKEGMIAGPKILEHMVDTVLQFEGEKTYTYRILRALKNRYGSTNEIGIFDMADKGLRELKNPSELFLADRKTEEAGVSIVAAIEGSRPILLEVQALVSSSGYSQSQRTANGIDNKRLQMIVAVLEKRLGIQFSQNDVFVNLAGGVYMSDPSVDLGIAAALVSSAKDISINTDTVIIGEIGLTGEVRSISQLEQRIKEAEKLGFKRILVPKSGIKNLNGKYKIKVVGVERIMEALSILLNESF